MIIKSVMFRREKGSPWEKGICINKSDKCLFIDENLEVMGTKEDRRVWDCYDTYDYINKIDFNNVSD